MDGQTNGGQTNGGQTYGWTDKWIDSYMDGQIGWIKGKTKRQTNHVTQMQLVGQFTKNILSKTYEIVRILSQLVFLKSEKYKVGILTIYFRSNANQSIL